MDNNESYFILLKENDLELEDIESHLYSQIYHTTNDETEENLTSQTNTLMNPVLMKNPNRYFGPWSPGSKFHAPRTPPKPNNPDNGFYSKNYEKPYKADISINQVVVLSPKSPIVCMTAKDLRNARWKENIRENRKERKKRRKERRLAKFKIQQQERKLAKLTQAQQVEQESVITLSDSDDESCVLIDNNWPVLSVPDSDEDKNEDEGESEHRNSGTANNGKPVNENLSDDVIFVEPVSVPVEVINLDEELEKSPQKDNPETAPSNLSNDKIQQQLHQERKELLSTPDSASNDFMNNSGVELNQRNFNFSLHGSDFNAGEFSKPGKPTDTCETESSSSTTDVNTANLSKNIVFNEVDFPRGDIFAEGNLEHFGNLITPARKGAKAPVAQSSPCGSSSIKNQNVYSSESSESDFEDPQVEKKKMKNLPELSHFHVSPEKSKYEPKQDKIKNKNKKKKKNLQESFNKVEEEFRNEEEKQKKKRRSDQLECSDENVETPPKKKSKNKKKKNETVQAQDNIIDSSGIDVPEAEKRTKNKKNKKDSVEAEATEITNTTESNLTVTEISHSQGEHMTVKSEPANSENAVSTEKLVEIDITDTIKKESSDISEQPSGSAMEGLDVIDETFCSDITQVLSSDSESVLSALNEQHNIQINVEKGHEQLAPAPLVSASSTDPSNFSVKELQLAMSNDPTLWDILDSDRMPPGMIGRGRRCNKCRQFGHGALRCPNKVYPKCNLCGEGGHYEPRCPNKLCTQCGQKSNYLTNYCGSCFKYRNFECRLCCMKGHRADRCPDLWRRYHLTTNEGPLSTYHGPSLKKREELWCSGCARNGHLEHDCNVFKSLYPPTDPYIKSYDNVYENPSDRKGQRRSNERRPNQFGPSQVHYSANINPNILMGQMHPNNYSNNVNPNYYAQMNNQYRANTNQDPNFDLMYMDNQQNFMVGDPNDIYQYTRNLHAAPNLAPHSFQNPLPAFISLDSGDTSNPSLYTEVPEADSSAKRYFKRTNMMKQYNQTFFSTCKATLQHFITEELRRLSKLYFVSNKMVKEFRKRHVPRRAQDKEEYYQTINMLLFGIFNLFDGKIHLEKLKQFRKERVKTKLTLTARRQLFGSYSYIFGCSPHDGVDYPDLLRRI